MILIKDSKNIENINYLKTIHYCNTESCKESPESNKKQKSIKSIHIETRIFMYVYGYMYLYFGMYVCVYANYIGVFI